MSSAQKIIQAAAGNAAGEATYVEDVFSTYLYTGNGSTQVIENGIALTDANTGGSVEFDGTSDWLSVPDSTDFDLTDDFTVEAWVYPVDLTDTHTYPTIFSCHDNLSDDAWIFSVSNANKVVMYGSGGNADSSTGTVNLNEWSHVAVSREGSTVRFFINGVLDASTYTRTGDYLCTSAGLGIGRQPTGSTLRFWEGYISNGRIVKGTALYTSSFTPSTTALTAVSGTSLLTCQGDTPFVDNSSNAHTITVNGDATAKAFGPFTSDTEGGGGLVWVKSRALNSASFTGHNHFQDTERGAGNTIRSDGTYAQTSEPTSVTSFNSNGFSLGSFTQVNADTADFASWTFRKAPKFFDVVTYTGDGTSGRQIAHNLGSEPGCVIVKMLTDGGYSWQLYHRGLTSASYRVELDTTIAETTSLNPWVSTAPTASVFTVSNSLFVNGSGKQYVAYLFAHNDGDGEFGESADQDIIKCGSYTGNGSTDGPEIDLGFEPQWLLVKRAVGGTEFWQIVDNMRGATTGGNDSILYPNANNAEVSTDVVEFNATGFQPKTTSGSWNASGNTYIYIAIRRGPMKTPESGTEVFAIDTKNVGFPSFISGFPVDMGIQTQTIGDSNLIASRLTGPNGLKTDSTAAEDSNSGRTWDYMNGWYDWSGAVSTNISWMFRRAPGFFDVVCYTGDNTTGQNINHNLNAVPEMILVKNREPANKPFVVYHSGANGGVTPEQYGGILNSTTAFFQYDGYWSDTAPTSTQFTVSTDDSAGGNYDYIAYLFATLDGISKVGSYTGNGTSQTIDCGFSAGARFFLVKASSTTGDWHVFDTERGIIAGNDPYLELNTTNAEDTDEDAVDPVSSGIIVNETSASNINTSGVTYIFMAIA